MCESCSCSAPLGHETKIVIVFSTTEHNHSHPLLRLLVINSPQEESCSGHNVQQCPTVRGRRKRATNRQERKRQFVCRLFLLIWISGFSASKCSTIRCPCRVECSPPGWYDGVTTSTSRPPQMCGRISFWSEGERRERERVRARALSANQPEWTTRERMCRTPSEFRWCVQQDQFTFRDEE